MTTRLRLILFIVGGLALTWITLTIILRLIARPSEPEFALDRRGGEQLVVLVHGLSGREALQPVVDLARETFPAADLLTASFDSHPLSNADVFDITNQLESRIHASFVGQDYESIVLVGHSMGAMIVRKVFLWGHGLEEDRIAKKGKRAWVDRVARVVSLAGINRGWSIAPRPANMGLGRYLLFGFGERVARLTGTGRLLLSVQKGAPFIADSRVQWIRLMRQQSVGAPRVLPQVIHLLGSRDDIVSHKDAADLGVAKGTVFVTLPGADHATLVADIDPASGDAAAERRETLRWALQGDLQRLSPDESQELIEDPAIKHVIYVMHGIRDYGDWSDDVRTAIEQRVQRQVAAGGSRTVAVVNKKYGYFPMLPFLLYWDRQENVRKFMDEYTENLAYYPNAERFDFVGHSNGTYILASALQRYRSPVIGRVYFAGSVVPKHYPWRPLLDQRRVERVVNVVADSDWVVAIFPKLFEQFADWRKVQPTTGLLDIGAAGFRGFQAADDPKGRLRNVQFVQGQHGAGVDTSNQTKLDAIVAYALAGDESSLQVFDETDQPWGLLDFASNISWLWWIVLAGLLWLLGWLAFRVHRYAGFAYMVTVLGLLTSV